MSSTIKLRLTAEIEYVVFEGCTDKEQLRKNLARAAGRVVEHSMSPGCFSGEEEAAVNSYTVHAAWEDQVTTTAHKSADTNPDQLAEMEDEYPIALRELASRTNTVPGDWVTEDGPPSGVGEDYYYRHCDRNEVWWVCVDQGEVTQCVMEQN
jgi:hypothetical protein